MVDIESTDATSAPVISVRFKLASFLLSKEAERRGQSLVPDRLQVFPELKRSRGTALRAKYREHRPNYPGRLEPSRIVPVELHR
jgi:hypothetical protein